MTEDFYGTRTIPAGEFKARCLKLMDEVQETGVSIVVTKRGRPVSRLVPVTPRLGGISGLLPEFSGLWDDPSQTVIDPSEVDLLGEDSGLDGGARI